MYLLRFDDASPYMDVEKWKRIENLMDKYNICPIIGIIPNNEDEKFIIKYKYNSEFWTLAKKWRDKKWSLALHGYNHKYISNNGGINPINKRSEFAGVPLDIQKRKIKQGIEILKKHDIFPDIFFSPAHSFDNNTLSAIKTESSIKFISDTIANDIYFKDGLYFIPLQAGKVRKLPFKLVTFCYHPNSMSNNDFIKLEKFIKKYNKEFKIVENIKLKKRKYSLFDVTLKNIYFLIRKIRGL